MATTAKTVSGAAYTDFGAGPLTAIATIGPVSLLMYSNATAPALDSDAAPIVLQKGEPMNYQYADKLWLKAAGGSAASIAFRVLT